MSIWTPFGKGKNGPFHGGQPYEVELLEEKRPDDDGMWIAPAWMIYSPIQPKWMHTYAFAYELDTYPPSRYWDQNSDGQWTRKPDLDGIYNAGHEAGCLALNTDTADNDDAIWRLAEEYELGHIHATEVESATWKTGFFHAFQQGDGITA